MKVLLGVDSKASSTKQQAIIKLSRTKFIDLNFGKALNAITNKLRKQQTYNRSYKQNADGT